MTEPASSNLWWYAVGGTRHGPVPQSQLLARIAAGEVSGRDLAWREGFDEWFDIDELPELAAALPPPIPGLGAAIPSYLWQAIAVTVLCCMPFGIPAIYHAAKVDSTFAQGNLADAARHSASARGWCWAAFFVGIFTGAGVSVLSVVR